MDWQLREDIMKGNKSLTRRQFAFGGIAGLAALALAQESHGELDVETFRALGLDQRFDWEQEINGRSRQEAMRFLRSPEDDQYKPCPEATPSSATPRGKLQKYEKWSESRIFSGTVRDLWIYQSAQLAASDQAPDLMVFQDGGGYVDPEGSVRVPAVLDSLTFSDELRPTVAVFVNPGTNVPPRKSSDPEFMRQRSLEYDSLTDTYAKFLLRELLPFVEGEIGRKLSADPARRLIGGISSGGICAWTAAWFRPDSFGRVLSHCGSFTNIRGGHNYPYLVRTTVRKPIRVFLTSGSSDLDIPLGNWPLANRQMAQALGYAGYDHSFVFGEGGHSLRHGGAIFADSLRWLHRSG